MRLSFCSACGDNDLTHLEHHHFVPRAEGGSDSETNMLTLCYSCHGKVHKCIRKDIRLLVKKGKAKARAKGVMVAPSKRSKQRAKMLQLWQCNLSIPEIAWKMELPVEMVYTDLTGSKPQIGFNFATEI